MKTDQQAAEEKYPDKELQSPIEGIENLIRREAYIQGREDECKGADNPKHIPVSKKDLRNKIGSFTSDDMLRFAAHIKDEDVDGWELWQWTRFEK